MERNTPGGRGSALDNQALPKPKTERSFHSIQEIHLHQLAEKELWKNGNAIVVSIRATCEPAAKR